LIENPLSEEMLKGGLEAGKKYSIDCDDDNNVSISEYLGALPPEAPKKRRKKTSEEVATQSSSETTQE
jgi:hypothetical protein